MNHIHSLYSCSVPGCSDYPMLVVTANMSDDSVSFREVYTDELGGTSIMVPKESGGAELATMLNTKYSGPSYWIEPNRHFTNIIAGGGFHDIMTDSLIELHNLQPHTHTKIITPNKNAVSIIQKPNIQVVGSTVEISGISKRTRVQLFTLNGKLLTTNTVNGPRTLTLSELKTGAYIIRLKSCEGTFSKLLLHNQ